MTPVIRLLLGSLMFFIATGTAFAADGDAAKKRAEVKKAAQAALDRFYKADPKLKGEVDKAPGAAVLTSFGISFIVGGAGGSGIAKDRKTGKETYIRMAQASAGVQVGAAQTDTLIVFKTSEAFTKFIDKGWEFGGGGGAEAAAGGKAVGQAGGGENAIADANYYTLTKNGLQVGGAFAGTKFWKDKDLN